MFSASHHCVETVIVWCLVCNHGSSARLNCLTFAGLSLYFEDGHDDLDDCKYHLLSFSYKSFINITNFLNMEFTTCYWNCAVLFLHLGKYVWYGSVLCFKQAHSALWNLKLSTQFQGLCHAIISSYPDHKSLSVLAMEMMKQCFNQTYQPVCYYGWRYKRKFLYSLFYLLKSSHGDS